MINQFKSYINKNLAFLNKGKLLIAISGGIDSVVLAHLCHKLNLNFALAHCNFNLRDEESDTDEAFVIQLAENLEVEVFVQGFDTTNHAKENKLSIQMAARELRYNWFKDLATQLNFDYILTAHHADDNFETFLINFTRGTGLNGLTGIPVVKDIIVRPLLLFSRQEIENYAKNNAITWREDSSNSSRKYLRNKLRHEVVPILKQINPQLLGSFQNTLSNLNDTAFLVEKQIQEFTKKAIYSQTKESTLYKISEFINVDNPKAYVFALFNSYGFTDWNDIVDLLQAESGKYVISSTHRLIKHREFLILSKIPSKEYKSIQITSEQITKGKVITNIGEFDFEDVSQQDEFDLNTIYIDKEKLEFPLIVRPWQQSDIFQPLGMKGKTKKLGKYLKDEKLNPIEKEQISVMTSNETIIWVIGKRADERFKVAATTKQILKIEIKKLI